MADRLGAALLATIWRAEFSLLLRYRKHSDRNCALAGESADLFLGGVGIARVPGNLHVRFCGSFADRSSRRGRHGVHVRSGVAADNPPAELVSCRNPTSSSVGDLAVGLRP